MAPFPAFRHHPGNAPDWRNASLPAGLALVSLLAGGACLLSEREPAKKIGQKSGLTATTPLMLRFPLFAQIRNSQVALLVPEGNPLE